MAATNLVRTAVFPVVGLGTRFLPATKASPKEILPVVDKPLIQYAVEEVYATGIRQMIFVTGRAKRAIEDHFDTAYELESELEAAGKRELLDLVETIKPDDVRCVYVRQSRTSGLGDTVFCAQEFVGNEVFAVLLADDLMVCEPPIMAQMVWQFNEWHSSIWAVQDVPREHTRRHSIVAGIEVNEKMVDINAIVEKPASDAAPSTPAVAGLYIFTSGVFDEIANQERVEAGEIQLTDRIVSLLCREEVLAYRYQGAHCDYGSKLSLLQATMDLAKRHDEIGPEFSQWLQQCGEVAR